MSRDSFNEVRAELFEALGHPLRISILESLESRPLGFAEIKRSVGIESSGHLQFHLRKLDGLVEDAASGAYALTNDGRDALRVFRTTAVKSSAQGFQRLHIPTKYLTIIIALGVLALLLSSALVIGIESNMAQTSSLNSQLSSGKDQISGLNSQLNSQKNQISSLQSQANSLQSQLSRFNQTILQGIFRVNALCGNNTANSCYYYTDGYYANLGGRTAYSANVTFTFFNGTGQPVCSLTHSLGTVPAQSGLYGMPTVGCDGAKSASGEVVSWVFNWS